MTKMIENIRTILWIAFLFVVVIEIFVSIALYTGNVTNLVQLLAITQASVLLGIMDRLLIVCLFGTFIFESKE